mgnify:CR=1 FL=1
MFKNDKMPQNAVYLRSNDFQASNNMQKYNFFFTCANIFQENNIY